MSEPTDILGQALSDMERDLMQVYRALGALTRQELPPAAAAGVAEALASLWQVVNDLALTDERPTPV